MVNDFLILSTDVKYTLTMQFSSVKFLFHLFETQYLIYKIIIFTYKYSHRNYPKR